MQAAGVENAKRRKEEMCKRLKIYRVYCIKNEIANFMLRGVLKYRAKKRKKGVSGIADSGEFRKVCEG